MKASRWPALLLIPLLLAAMVAVDRSDDEGATGSSTTTAVPDPGRRPDAMPIAAALDAERAAWYCPVVGTSPDPDAPPPPEPSVDETTTTTGEDTTTTEATTTTEPDTTTSASEDVEPGDADPLIERTVLLLTNIADEPRIGHLRLFGADGPTTTDEITVEGASRWQQDVTMEDGRPGAALIELDGGGVAASLLVEGPHGSTVTPCLSQPAASWFVPAAATGTPLGDDEVALDARAVLHLFNPFPDDAIVEIAFWVNGEAPRIPTGFDAYPVPASSVVAIELGVRGIESAQPQFSTSIRARSGQVVAGLVQEYDGTETAEGLAVVPGAPEPAPTWFFPSGRWNDETRERFVLYNPGEEDALVALSVALDDPATNGSVAPFELTVPAGGYVGLGSSDDDWARVPPDVGHSVSIRSQNGQPVVAVQRITVTGDEAGFAMALGSPLIATEWIVPVVDLADTSRSLTVLNPSPLSRTRVSIVAVGEGDSQELPEIELAEAARAAIQTADDIDLEHAGARVTGTEPVVVSSAFSFDEGGRAWIVAVPIAGTTVAPDPIEGAAPAPGD